MPSDHLFTFRPPYPMIERRSNDPGSPSRFVRITAAIAASYRDKDSRDHNLGLLAVDIGGVWLRLDEGMLIVVNPDAIISIAPASRGTMPFMLPL